VEHGKTGREIIFAENLGGGGGGVLKGTPPYSRLNAPVALAKDWIAAPLPKKRAKGRCSLAEARNDGVLGPEGCVRACGAACL